MKMVFKWYTSMVWTVKTNSGCFADLIDIYKAYLFDYTIYMPNIALHGVQVEGVHDEDVVELTPNFTIRSGSTFYPTYLKKYTFRLKIKKMRSK